MLRGQLDIGNSFVLYLFDPFGKFQRLNTFFKVCGSSADGANQCRFGVATQTFAEQLSQLWISKRYERPWLSQGCDNSSQSGQAHIYFLGLFKCFPGGACLPDSLGASQIYKVEFGPFSRPICVELSIFQDHYGVTPRAPLIHSGCSHLNLFLSLLDIEKYFFRALNRNRHSIQYFTPIKFQILW